MVKFLCATVDIRGSACRVQQIAKTSDMTAKKGHCQSMVCLSVMAGDNVVNVVNQLLIVTLQ